MDRHGKNNPFYGKKHTNKTKQKMRESKLSEKNPMWKGNNASIYAIHCWVRGHKQKSDFCKVCGELPPFDVANISGEYKRDVDDYQWLCRRCHMKSDGRLNNLKQYRVGD